MFNGLFGQKTQHQKTATVYSITERGRVVAEKSIEYTGLRARIILDLEENTSGTVNEIASRLRINPTPVEMMCQRLVREGMLQTSAKDLGSGEI